MNRTAFRRFEFFEPESVAKDIHALFGAIPTCAVAESGMLIFGDELGNVTISDRDFHSTDRRHKIFNGEVHSLVYLFDKTNNNRQFIVALGDDSRPVETFDGTVANPTPIYVIKVYSTHDMVRPLYKLNATISDGYVTSFAVLHDGTEIAVGYSTGKILLFTGFFLRENSQGKTVAPAVIHPSHFAPVSSLYFCEIGSGYGDDRKVKLFAVMNTPETVGEDNKPAVDTLIEQEDIQHAGIIVFDTSITLNAGKGTIILSPREDAKALDAKGSSPLCASFMKTTSELVISRNEAVYTYTIEDRGGALAIFGEKLAMVTVGRYTLVVSVEEKPAVATNNNSNNNSNYNQNEMTKSNKLLVTVYDLKNKFICGTSKKYYLPPNEKVAQIFSDGGMAYILTTNSNLFRFREKDVNRKLDVLLNQVKPPLYSLAITLAGEEQLEAQEIMKLYKMYGDHLYNKHEFDAAIVQYCYTIGYVPPSYVIVKFLDSYRIKNLITYLEKLKDKGLAAMDHLSLLLSCYVKNKDELKIKDILDYVFTQTMKLRANKDQDEKSASTNNNKNNNNNSNNNNNANNNNTNNTNTNSKVITPLIDPQQSIIILNDANFEDHALKIAVLYFQHIPYLKIQLTKNPPRLDEAMGYLAYMTLTCTQNEFLLALQLYGKTLLEHRPKQYTTLLTKYCINDLDSILSTPPTTTTTTTTTTSSAAPAANKKGSTSTTTAVNNHSANSTAVGDVIWSTDLINALNSFLHINKRDTSDTMNSDPIQPEDFIKYFYDDEFHLLSFLEGIVNASKGRVLSPKLWTTFMELNMKKYHFYVLELSKLEKQLASNSSNNNSSNENMIYELETNIQQLEILIMNILDGPNAQYDPAHALLLCSMFAFDKGERYLLERQQSIDLLINKLIEAEDSKEVFKLLRKEGTKEPELFVQVLTYFVQKTMQTLPSPTNDKNGINSKGNSNKKKSSASSSRRISDKDVALDSDDDSVGSDHSKNGRMIDDEDDEAKWDAVIDIVELIEKENILSPTQVFSILSLNPDLPLKVVSNYVNNVFHDLKDQIFNVTKDVNTAVSNLQSISFSTNAENQLKQTKKALARAQRKATFGYDEYDEEEDEEDAEDEKAAELMEREKWNSILRSQQNAAQEHEAFYKELELSTDGFTTVANYFGKTMIY